MSKSIKNVPPLEDRNIPSADDSTPDFFFHKMAYLAAFESWADNPNITDDVLEQVEQACRELGVTDVMFTEWQEETFAGGRRHGRR